MTSSLKVSSEVNIFISISKAFVLNIQNESASESESFNKVFLVRDKS